MRSQIAACRLATRRLEELFDKFGSDTIHGALDQVFDESETKCRNVVSGIPDGVYEAESFHKDDGIDIGNPVRVHAKVTVKGSEMEIDLSGCSGARKAAVNSRTYAGARVAYKALTAPVEPVNEGSFRALNVIIPEGNIMMAEYPAPMCMWSMVVPTVVDTIIKAPAPGMKDNVPAGKFRGGFGMETKVRNFVEGNRICEPPKRGEVCPAWGLWDGNAGHVGEYRMRKPGEDDHTLVETPAISSRRTPKCWSAPAAAGATRWTGT